MYAIYFFLALFVTSSHVNSKQHWAEEPSSTFVNPGGEVILACRINNMGGDCRWEKKIGSRAPVPVGIYAGKYEWAGRTELGDCSLRILQADFDYDNAKWICQVTASGFRETDTLISREAHVSVRVAPESVRIRNAQTSSGEDEEMIRGEIGQAVAVECIVKGGNPAPSVRWFYGSKEIEGGVTSINQESKDLTSLIHIPVTKETPQKEIRCAVEHDALEAGMEARIGLDIQFAPEIQIKPSKTPVLTQEGASVNISCTANANPVATIIWKRKENNEIKDTTGGLLKFSEVSKNDAGIYVCQATNEIGVSEAKEVQVDVQFGAAVSSVIPAGQIQKKYNTNVELTCEGEGNPPPLYKWVQSTKTGAVTRSEEKVLRIDKLDYKDQGDFWCEVNNKISSSRSEVITLNVEGPPKIKSDNKHVFLLQGRDATLEVEFCGSPIPKQTWQIESVEKKVALVAGTSHDKYKVENERRIDTRNCYVSVLHIFSADQLDSKDYVLKLENVHGEEIHKAHVTIGEELSKETLIGSVVGVAVTLLLVLIVLVCICRRCCKQEKQLKESPERKV